jgi:hypothetical protein
MPFDLLRKACRNHSSFGKNKRRRSGLARNFFDQVEFSRVPVVVVYCLPLQGCAIQAIVAQSDGEVRALLSNEAVQPSLPVSHPRQTAPRNIRGYFETAITGTFVCWQGTSSISSFILSDALGG